MERCPVEQFPFWKYLSKQEQEYLCGSIQAVCYRAGQIVRSSEECLGILLVQSGVLRAGLLSEDGRLVTISRMSAGEVCVLSASCILSAITFDVQIDAETDCELLVIPPMVFARLMKDNIYVENFVNKSAVERFSDVIGAVERILFYTLEQRLAAFLLDESAREGRDELHITQEQIAQNIGSAREAVTRAMKQLADKGCVELRRGVVQLKDRRRLYQICENT